MNVGHSFLYEDSQQTEGRKLVSDFSVIAPNVQQMFVVNWIAAEFKIQNLREMCQISLNCNLCVGLVSLAMTDNSWLYGQLRFRLIFAFSKNPTTLIQLWKQVSTSSSQRLAQTSAGPQSVHLHLKGTNII